MKGTIALLAVTIVATWGTCGVNARAELVASDNFDSYAVGELNGQNEGIGWNGAWVADTATSEVITPSTPVHSANTVQFNGTSPDNNTPLYRQLATTQSGDIYVSYVFRYDEGLDGNDFVTLWLDDVGNESSHLHTEGSAFLGVTGGNGFFVRLSESNDGSARSQQETGFGPLQGQAYTVVGRLFKDGSTDYNKFTMWIDPTLDDVANNVGGVTVTRSGIGLSGISHVGIRTGASTESTGQYLVDSLQIGTQPLDVVPEPSNLALLISLMLVGSAILSRCRKQPK